MIKPTVKVHVPRIEIHTPEDRRFWKAVGLELTKDMVKRTQSGKDADNRTFKPYKKATVKQRVSRNRSAKVNLTDTGRLMTSLARSVRSRKDGLQLRLAGESGFKAYNIKFNQRRNFFAFNDKQVKRVIKKIKAWMKRKNK